MPTYGYIWLTAGPMTSLPLAWVLRLDNVEQANKSGAKLPRSHSDKYLHLTTLGNFSAPSLVMHALNSGYVERQTL
jgi:hypothetical protein